MLLPEIMLLPLLHTHDGEVCDHRAVLFWGRAFPSCYNSSRKQTQARTASASSHYHKGQKRAGLPPHLLPASRCSLLKHRCPASTPGMIMASLPYGNIHPKYPALIFLPSPRNAKPWGRKILPWGRSIPPARLVTSFAGGSQAAGTKRTWPCYLFCSRPQNCQWGLRGPRAEPAVGRGLLTVVQCNPSKGQKPHTQNRHLCGMRVLLDR